MNLLADLPILWLYTSLKNIQEYLTVTVYNAIYTYIYKIWYIPHLRCYYDIVFVYRIYNQMFILKFNVFKMFTRLIVCQMHLTEHDKRRKKKLKIWHTEMPLLKLCNGNKLNVKNYFHHLYFFIGSCWMVFHLFEN